MEEHKITMVNLIKYFGLRDVDLCASGWHFDRVLHVLL